MRGVLLALATMLLGSCASHIEKLQATISEVGRGRILSVENVTGETGESAADRYAMGFVVGGVPGALIVGNSEKDIGRANLFKYTLQLRDGSALTVRSFSAVAVDDCVKLIRISTKQEMVLERLDTTDLCKAAKAN